jgi:hypothetical protein
MTFDTRPRLASLSTKTPPLHAQSPTATTSVGSGVASQVLRRAVSMCRYPGPVTSSKKVVARRRSKG